MGYSLGLSWNKRGYRGGYRYSRAILWLGPLSRAGLGLAACRFIGSSRVPFFFYCRECARAGGVPGEGGEGCVADRRVEGLNHKDYTPELPTTKIYQYVA